VGLILASVGLPGLEPLPWRAVIGIFVYAAVCCLVVNDTLKVFLIRKLTPAAVA
jgi:hypothetical protein